MQKELFSVAACLHIISVILFLRNDRRLAVFFLLLGGIVLRLYFTGLEPYLHEWDERFHALVAKNITKHWLTPTLTDHALLQYDYHKWTEAHIWLHKQPLFLWQMALSIRLLGANEFAVRLPSLVMTSMLILIIYQCGRLLFNCRTAFIAAFIFSCYEPVLEQNSGIAMTDHNDIAFLFYVSLSIYCWLCFEKKKQARYIYLMGLFSGMAVLTKWLTGLTVYIGFGFYHLLFMHDFFKRGTLSALGKSLAVCFLAFMPWQLYILCRFPLQAQFEYAYSHLHFTQAMEGHGGDIWYYIRALGYQYKGLQLFILTGIGVCLVDFSRNKLALSLALMAISVYLFFSIAATKMPFFVVIMAPVNMIFIAVSISKFFQLSEKWIAGNAWIQFITYCILFYLFIDPASVRYEHFDDSNWKGGFRRANLEKVQVYHKLASSIPPDMVIVGFAPHDNINCMFYTNNTCYPEISESDFRSLRQRGHRVLYMSDTLPAYARSDDGTKLAKEFISK